MNIFISPSNYCLLAMANNRFQLSFIKQDKKQKFENNNFILLLNILFHEFTAFYQKKLPYVDKAF